MSEFGHECWIMETSKDGERWRFFGKAWKEPVEALLLHAVPRYVRVRPDGDPQWREPLEASDDMPITLLRVEESIRPGAVAGCRARWSSDAALGRRVRPAPAVPARRLDRSMDVRAGVPGLTSMSRVAERYGLR